MKLKNILLPIGLVAAIGVIWYIVSFKSPKPQVSTMADSCPEEKLVTVDLEKSTYSGTNVVEVVGGVTGNIKFAELEYDLVDYTGGLDAIYEFDAYSKDGKLSPAIENHTGWQKVPLSSTQAPLTFSLKPTFPSHSADNSWVGIYFRIVCSDGTSTPDRFLTRMVIDRHLSGNRLYAVTSSNPNKLKQFK